MKAVLLQRFLAILCVLGIVCLPGAAQASSITAGAAAPQWLIERVDAPPLFDEMEPSSLKLHNGNPRVAYGADHLYFSYSNNGGTSWMLTYVDLNFGVGRYASLAVDASGAAHISYFDATNNDLKYAVQIFDGGPDLYHWNLTVVDSGNVNGYTSIALDTSGKPLIAYQKDRELWFARCTTLAGGICSAWTTAQLDTGATDSGFYTAVAVDASNQVHVVHLNKATDPDTVRYGLYNGSSWGSFYDIVPHSGRYMSLAVDSGNYPHVAYMDDSSANYLVYTYQNSGGWVEELVNMTGSDGAYYPSLALYGNDGDAPYISYKVGSSVKVAYYDEMDPSCPGGVGDWNCVVAAAESGKFTSLAVAGGGGATPQITYYNATDGRMRYVSGVPSGSWAAPKTLHTGMDAGGKLSLALDPGGKPHLAYQDVTSSQPRYARLYSILPGGCGDDSSGENWQCMPIGESTRSGSYLSIAIDSNLWPNLAYSRDASPELKYASHMGVSWGGYWTVDSTGGSGKYAAIALDASHTAHIAYYRYITQDIMFATYLGSAGNCGGPSLAWKCEIVDNAGASGGLSLALQNDGKAVIAYYDATDGTVKVAYEVGSGGTGCTGGADWDCDVVESGVTADISYDISLALTSGNVPRIVYQDSLGSGPEIIGLDYAYASAAGKNATWTKETIQEGTGAVNGGMNDLALDSSGNPWAVYSHNDYTASAYDLMLAQRVGGGAGDCYSGSNWSCLVVDAVGDVGNNPEIALTSGNLIYIAYYDATNGDVKLAYQAYLSFIPMVRK